MVTFYGQCGSVLVRFVERHEERVGHAFGGEVGARAVARNDLDVARGGRGVEGEELLEDALHELVVVAAGVVGTADGAGEEGVAGEEHAVFAFEEADAAGGVARSFDDFETEGADLDDITLDNGYQS